MGTTQVYNWFGDIASSPTVVVEPRNAQELSAIINFILVLAIRGKNTLPPDQIIRYPEKSTNSRYTFSIWAFPEQDYMRSLRDYFLFYHDYYWKTGYRFDLPSVGYRIHEDTSSLFS